MDPAHLLSSLRAQKGELALALGGPAPVEAPALAPGHTELSPALREALLLPGAVVEVAGAPGKGGLSLSLQCLVELLARELSASTPSQKAWTCMLDPSRCLHAPAVAALGLPLERLVVVTPPPSSLLRIAVRVMKAGVFCGVVVDATGLADFDDAAVAVRRLTIAAEASASTVFFLTDDRVKRKAPLPAAVRARVGGGVVVERHRFGVRDTFPWEPPRSPLQRFWGR